METTKQKINRALGIPADQGIDAFLDTISQDTKEIATAFQAVDETVKTSITKLDTDIEKL